MVMASKEQGPPEFLTSRTREVDGAPQVTQEHKQQLVNGGLSVHGWIFLERLLPQNLIKFGVRGVGFAALQSLIR